MFSVNKKIYAVSLLLLLASCQNGQEQAQERLKRGKALLAKGDFANAEVEIENAIQGDRNLADSYYTMALLNEENRNYKAMKDNLLQAVKLAPENDQLHLKLGKVLLLFNEVDEAANEVNYVLKKSPKELSALSLKAAVLLRQKKLAEALPLIDEILKKDPKNTDVLSLKALVYMENEDFDEALSFIDPAINANTENSSLYLLKLQLNAKRKDIDAVVKNYQYLAKKYPKKSQLKIALAKLLVYAKKPQEAEDLLRQFVASKPWDIEPKFVLLSLLESLDEAKAMAQLGEYSQHYHDRPKELLQLSKWLLLRKKTDEAKQLLDKVARTESQPEKVEAKLLLAKIAFRLQDTDVANTLINSILDIDSEYYDAKILQARVWASENKYEEARTLLTSVHFSNPKSDEALVMLAHLELLNGWRNIAYKQLNEALEINPANLDALLPVVNNLIKKRNFNYATGVLTRALQYKPKNEALLQKQTQIKMLEKDWDGANKILKILAKQPNGFSIATFMQGKIFQEKNEWANAIDKYKQLLQKSPLSLEAMQEMGACYEELKQRPRMMAYLSALIEQNKKNIPAYLVKSNLFLLEQDFENSISILNQAVTINNKIPQIYSALADNYLRQNKVKKALYALKKGQKAIPNDLKMNFMLASVYKKTGEYDRAAEIYEMLLSNNANLDIVANELASLLIDFFGDEKSLMRAREVAARFKDSKQPFYLDTYAWIELKLNNVSEAIEKLKNVNRLSATIPVFKYHLGVAYHRRGLDSVAISELRQAVALGNKKRGFSESEKAKSLLIKLLRPAIS